MRGGRFHIGLGRRNTPPDPPVGLGGKLVASLFFGLFLGLGLLFTVMIGREAWRGLETWRWAERRCEILESGVARDSGESPYRAEVRFRTLDRDPTVEGQALQRRRSRFSTWNDASQRLDPYPPGAVVSCFVSEAGEAVLERGPPWIGLWVLFALVFVAIGAGGLYVTWRPERRDAFGRVATKPLGEGVSRRGTARTLARIGALLGLVGLVSGWFLALRPLLRMHEARSWSRATCTVEHSSVVAHDSDDGTTYSVDILYRWDRGRGVERSSRYGFFGGSSSGRAGKAEIVRRHPVGAEVPCWIDPDARNEAVLERGLTAHAWIAVVPLGFLVGGLVLFVVGRRQAARRSRLREGARLGRLPFAPDDPILEVLPDFELSPGPIDLEASSSRSGRLAGIVFATLFWNGIVAVFVNQAWQGHARGHPDPFLTIFLVPFVLVGIGLVFAVLYTLLGLSNARPRLRASTPTPPLGESVELEWSLQGRTRTLERVRIVLRGREEATYRVGTNSRTAKETFFEQTLVEVPRPACALGGHASFTLPASSMHSFKSAHNAIVWELAFEGEIRRWPDVSETFPIVVLPGRASGEKRED